MKSIYIARFRNSNRLCSFLLLITNRIAIKMEKPSVLKGSDQPTAEDFTESLHTTEKRYVLVLYTGGTIGMKETSEGS